MNSGDRHIRRVIEPLELRVRRAKPGPRRTFGFSPRQALFLNDHPDAIVENFERSECAAVLRESERHVLDWERQQTPGRAAWLAAVRQRTHLSTGAAAKEIVRFLRA